MLKRIAFSRPVKVIGGVLLVFLLWQAFVFLRPRPEDIPDTALVLFAGAAHDTANWLGPFLGDGTAPARVGLVRLDGDPYGTVTHQLGAALDARPELSWDQTPVVQRFVQDVGSAAWNSTSLEELATSGRRVKLEGLVTGRVLLPEDGTPPSLQLRVFDLRPGGTMRELSFPGRELSAKEVRAVASGGSDFSFGWFVLAVLVILALPWLTPFCTEWAVGRKSNGASALLLMGYVAADVLVLGLVPGLGARLSGGLILPALAAALCAGYSHWACETVAARRR